MSKRLTHDTNLFTFEFPVSSSPEYGQKGVKVNFNFTIIEEWKLISYMSTYCHLFSLLFDPETRSYKVN